ncbi:MAG: hypothetical protein H6Q89_3143 [Myxococcaceae bacterium]|nr:hypothetical protein [Myxococcaceae bacterium]
MSTTNAVIQLHHREIFETNVIRGLAAGAGAGVLALLTSRIGAPVPLAFLAIAGTSLAAVRGDKFDKLLLAGLSVVACAAPWLFGLSMAWTIALSGAAAGALMVKSRLCERGVEGSVGASRPGLLNYAVGAVATAGLAVGGFEVARVLGARMADFQTPPLLAVIVTGLVMALFTSIGGMAAHLALKADPVEARCEELIPQLSGEFQTQAQRALTLYRACGQSLQALPREPAREELAKTLQRLTRDAVELAAEWAGVEAQLQDDTQKELAREIADLHKSAAEARDPIARRQLEMAASSLKEEIDRLGELRLKRERILAKLKSQVALLERARVALIGMRSGHAQIKAAEMSALARKFTALAGAQADEAKLAHEVATGTELAAQEAALQQAVKVAEGIVGAPISPISAPAEAEAKIPASETIKN